MSESKQSISAQLKAHHLRPNKKLGQNFLLDDHILEKIAALSLEMADAEVLEIGAGLGGLTAKLADLGKPLTAIEIDRGIFSLLQERFADSDNVSLVLGDILQMDLDDIFPQTSYQVIANIPYYLTSKLIRQLLGAKNQPKMIHILVQKEVAIRACEDAPRMNLLSLSIRLFGQAKRLFDVSAGAFYPAPKVDSSILRIRPMPESNQGEETNAKVMRLARAAFQQKRKTLLNSLSSLPEIEKAEASKVMLDAGMDPAARPQHLNSGEWLRLAKLF